MLTVRRILPAVLLWGLVVSFSAAQDWETVLLSYERHFIRASLNEKASILNDAATDDKAGDFYGPFCAFALDFALKNAELLGGDPDFENLTVSAIRGLGSSGYVPGLDTLWQGFISFRANNIRVEILNSIARLGRGQGVERVNRFLLEQNKLFESGVSPDYPILRALVATLREVGDESSRPALFQTMMLPYQADFSVEAREALLAIKGDPLDFLRDVVLNRSPREKAAAFKLAMDLSTLIPARKGELAEAALEAGLDLEAAGAGKTEGLELRDAAVTVIRDLKWVRALPLVVKHFYLVEAVFRSDPSVRPAFLDAIACLSAMETSDAAQILSLHLGLFNSRMELSGTFDSAVVLALINALGNLGDKSAFDYLNYISFLPYPDSIQNAAKAALTRLRW